MLGIYSKTERDIGFFIPRLNNNKCLQIPRCREEPAYRFERLLLEDLRPARRAEGERLRPPLELVALFFIPFAFFIRLVRPPLLLLREPRFEAFAIFVGGMSFMLALISPVDVDLTLFARCFPNIILRGCDTASFTLSLPRVRQYSALPLLARLPGIDSQEKRQ